jgi:peptidylprolyl isomerase
MHTHRSLWTATLALILLLATLPTAGCGGGDEAADYEEAPAPQLNDESKAIEMLTAGEAEGKELVSSATGLQYVDLVVGDGPGPQPGQTCVTHATGRLLDGSVFWSSREPARDGAVKPFEFPLGRGRAIPGFDQGVAGMKVGGVRRMAIPPQLGYGEGGAGRIPPNATLIFDVELLEVKD